MGPGRRLPTHVESSARALSEHGVSVSVLAARVDEGEAIPGVDLIERPSLMDIEATAAERIGPLPYPDRRGSHSPGGQPRAGQRVRVKRRCS